MLKALAQACACGRLAGRSVMSSPHQNIPGVYCFCVKSAHTSMRLWASGWLSHDVQLAPEHSGRVLFLCQKRSGVKTPSPIPICRSSGARAPPPGTDSLCLLFLFHGLILRPKLFICCSRQKGKKGGTQPATEFSPIGRGNARLPRPPCRCPLLILLVLRGTCRS